MKRLLILLLTGSLLPACSTSTATRITERPPNIIHIMADDFGYGELGSYGQEFIRTPNLDQLASSGMRFTQHYSGSPVCAPARFAYMTGLHSGTSGIINNKVNHQLSQHSSGVARSMKSAGYTTGMIGKWGLGRPQTPNYPLNQGFDYFFGYAGHADAHNYYPEYLMENESRFPLRGNTLSLQPGLSENKVTYAPALINERAIAFMERHRNKKFYLQLHYNLPHVNSALLSATGNGWEHPGISRYQNTDWTAAEQDYAELVSLMDDYVGEVMSALDSYGLTENTIVFFTSDNGPEGARTMESIARFLATDGLKGKKGELFEGGIRVPLIAWGPAYIKPGQVVDQPTAFWDMLPTLSEIAAVDEPFVTDGVSFAPILFGTGEMGEREFLYWSFKDSIAVREGHWKWVRDRKWAEYRQKDFLYNLADDPREEKNLAKEYPEKLYELMLLAQPYQSKSVFGGTGLIISTLCSIPDGQSTCNANIKWESKDTTDVSVIEWSKGFPNGSIIGPDVTNNPTGTTYALPHGTYQLTLTDDDDGNRLLHLIDLTIECVNNWNPTTSECEASSDADSGLKIDEVKPL